MRKNGQTENASGSFGERRSGDGVGRAAVHDASAGRRLLNGIDAVLEHLPALSCRRNLEHVILFSILGLESHR